MSEKFSIELDNEFLEKFFGMADMPVPDSLDIDSFDNAANKIKSKLDTAASLQSVNVNTGEISDELEQAGNLEEKRPRSVLVVDDLGIVTLQLKRLFEKHDFAVTTSGELFDAIEKYKTQDFGFAIVDLFIPTEREGFILIDEIKKLSLICKLDTKIIVMSASNKKEHQNKCMGKGANLYMEKLQGWQDKMLKFCINNLTAD